MVGLREKIIEIIATLDTLFLIVNLRSLRKFGPVGIYVISIVQVDRTINNIEG